MMYQNFWGIKSEVTPQLTWIQAGDYVFKKNLKRFIARGEYCFKSLDAVGM